MRRRASRTARSTNPSTPTTSASAPRLSAARPTRSPATRCPAYPRRAHPCPLRAPNCLLPTHYYLLPPTSLATAFATQAAYLNALRNFDLLAAFPDMNNNYHAFRVSLTPALDEPEPETELES